MPGDLPVRAGIQGSRRRTARIRSSDGRFVCFTPIAVPAACTHWFAETAMPTWLITVGSVPLRALNTRSPGRMSSVRQSIAVPNVACRPLYCGSVMPTC
jgi:hypothetical protein